MKGRGTKGLNSDVNSSSPPQVCFDPRPSRRTLAFVHLHHPERRFYPPTYGRYCCLCLLHRLGFTPLEPAERLCWRLSREEIILWSCHPKTRRFTVRYSPRSTTWTKGNAMNAARVEVASVIEPLQTPASCRKYGEVWVL
ncbi:hypothetical protein HPP92_025794 [Vanilla planifolia]|uniref:Uncharacterized protein n=1 Tax=Vanilla planifolia TaxID=51239 RepID=A0A835U8V5_VANPL|nr:hypothetical protein HPP92_026088 [Vanilla planifolia]KAG0452245.1 hypothetical protein HPP92_025794 [Vanilla planifolia]